MRHTQLKDGVSGIYRAWIGVAASSAVALTVFATGGLFSERAAAQDMDINAIFWCEGKPIGTQTKEQCEATRATILSACTVCHVFSPIVLTQRTPDEWDAFFNRHRGRVTEMSDADYDGIREFVTVHFNPDNPVPTLPEPLMNFTLPPD
jgi:hypothetical protein